MGRPLLILIAVAALLGCADESRPVSPADPAATVTGAGDAARIAGTDSAEAAHADVACAGCHRGAQIGTMRAAVPNEACTTSGCHGDAGPAQVTLATATFEHRRHGAGGTVTPSCAGCHTHDRGEDPLVASVSACALCHLSEVNANEPTACQACHRNADHTGLTSAALPVAHSALPSLETGCVRCHYDVAEATTRVPSTRCAACHTDARSMLAQGTGVDLHPAHAGVACTSCHDGNIHEVRAMSSAVRLICADCHTRAHDVVADSFPHAASCATCHDEVHSAQQQLLLGLMPEGRAAPSVKFIAGVTCRSCHIPDAAPADGSPIRGTAEACASCHPAQYEEVLDWWLEGARRRARMTRAYVDRARADVGAAGDSAGSLVARANAMLAVVEEAGAQHNLELSDRLFHQAVELARQAYAQRGRAAPTPPALGTSAHVGTCSYCHYSPTEPWDFRAMPRDFHERAMQARPVP